MSKLDDILPPHIVYASGGPDGEPTGTDLNAHKRQQIKDLFLRLMAECEYEISDSTIDAPTFKQVDGNKLKQLIEEL